MTSQQPVPARISLATLGVADLARATEFYRGLGWDPSSASVEDEVTFFKTDGGLLALWSQESLAADADIEAPASDGFRGVALAINVESREAVDSALERAVASGGRLLKPATAAEWRGYSGYFADPDGHVWEVALNPAWPIGPDGRPDMP